MTSADMGSERAPKTEEVSLYAKWQKIYPLWVQGPFQRFRRVMLGLLLVVFYVSPWLTWNGQQGVWFDIPHRRFTIFWTTFHPQEFIYLSWLLMIAAFSLFFFTVIAGRLWCGYACPQTVWTLVFQWIEKQVEGDRNQRLRLDRGRFSAEWFRKKSLKWSLWLALGISMGFTFVAYFKPPLLLLEDIATLQIRGWYLYWLLFGTGFAYLFAGVLREQVCLHMCPYARFQSVMFDKDTLVISYDAERGEPRGSRGRSVDPAEKGLGACVDCKMCVHACPTGIDIRDGLQYQCIGCAQCIDACNTIMARMGYEPNLVRYSSQHEDHHEKVHRIRPRLIGYGAILLVMLGTFSWSISHRVPLELDVIRDRNRLYREIWDGSVENVYTLRIINREPQARSYRISANAALPVELQSRFEDNVVEVPSGEQLSVPVQLIARPTPEDDRNSDVEFTIETIGEPRYEVMHVSRFVSPERKEP